MSLNSTTVLTELHLVTLAREVCTRYCAGVRKRLFKFISRHLEQEASVRARQVGYFSPYHRMLSGSRKNLPPVECEACLCKRRRDARGTCDGPEQPRCRLLSIAPQAQLSDKATGDTVIFSSSWISGRTHNNDLAGCSHNHSSRREWS